LDDGTGNPKQPLKSDWSIGLRNVEERVKIFFGPAAYMKAGVETQGGFRSSIIIPTNYLGES
jgi:sensor histidine kinase YesM